MANTLFAYGRAALMCASQAIGTFHVLLFCQAGARWMEVLSYTENHGGPYKTASQRPSNFPIS